MTAKKGRTTDTSYAGSITLTSSQPKDTLPIAATAAVNGVATASVTVNGSNHDKITATDTGHLTASETIAITAGPATSLVVAPRAAPPTNPTGSVDPTCATPAAACWIDGQVVAVKVTALDAEGNTATGYTGTVTLADQFTPTGGVPGAGTDNVPASPYSFLAADNGARTFSVALRGPSTGGSDLITATDPNLPNGRIAAWSSAPFAVAAGAVTKLRIGPTPPSSPIAAGTPTAFTVDALNAYGQVTTYTGTVHLTSSDASAAMPADHTFATREDGTYTLGAAAPEGEVTFHSAGVYTVAVSDTAAKSKITGTTSLLRVTPATPTKLKMSVVDSAIDGQTVTLTVAATDANGYPATVYAGTVTLTDVLTLGDGHTTVANGDEVCATKSCVSLAPGSNGYPYSATKDKGVHTFSVKLLGCESGTCQDAITATDAGTGTIAAPVTINMTETPGKVTKLSISPNTANKGIQTAFTVTPLNAYGQEVTTYTGTVHFASSDPWTQLPPDGQVFSAGTGLHSFPVTFGARGWSSVILTVRDMTNPAICGTNRVTVS